VCERPLDRELPDLAIVLVDIGAAAVLEVAGDRVVVVSVDGRDAALFDQLADFVRVRAVSDQVAAVVDSLRPQLIDSLERGLEGRKVGVRVGDDCDAQTLSLISAAGAHAQGVDATWTPHRHKTSHSGGQT
jgi:hypothetical protein